MAPNCPLIKQILWFCYFCNADLGHKGPDCPNKGAVQQPRRYDNIQFKDHTTQNYTNNYTQFRGNKNFRERGNNRGRGNTIRGGGKENFRCRIFKRGGIEAQEAQDKMHLYKEQQHILQVRLIKITNSNHRHKFLHSRHVRCNEKLVYKDTYKHKSDENDKSEETEESKDPEKEIVPVHSEEKETQAEEIQENKPEEKQLEKKQKHERLKKRKSENKEPDN